MADDPAEPMGPAPESPASPEAPRHVADHEPVGGGHTGSGGVDDRTVPWRVFLTVGGLVAVIAVIYWFTSYEDAGSVLLALAAVLAIWCGSYLWLQLRQRPAAGETAGGPEAEAPAYLPHASAWPFAIGLGAATVLNGLVLGTWVVVPGVALLALGVGGFVQQTRQRD
jgi:Cytochrome c oxidase subunit IV